MVPVDALRAATASPRTAGVDMDYVRVLTESFGQLPPIVVHRSTMCVIDGMHRLCAARLLGKETIKVSFFAGDAAAAFVLAVQSNVAHGLPLSLAERGAAAARIVRSHAQWSDRMIASVTGLSPKTVGVIRVGSSEEIPQSDVRIGRDGRVRHVRRATPGPTDEKRPDGPHTDAGADGLVPEQRRPRSGAVQPAGELVRDNKAVVRDLQRDPRLRFSEAGRLLLRMLNMHSLGEHDWDRLIANVPSHCARRVADAAQECANAWQVFAERLGQSCQDTGGSRDRHGLTDPAAGR